MNNLSNMLMDLIETEVLQTIDFKLWRHIAKRSWVSRRRLIIDSLNRLQPSIPEDGSTGKIAFNVPSKDRMKIKTGRFLTRKLNLNSGFLSDKSIAVITGDINSELFSDDVQIELVRGQEITKAYEDGIGAVTCMCTGGDGGGPNCTLLYKLNPDRFQMLIMHYQADSARAIVHKLDNGRYFMDRVYSSCSMLVGKMQSYAEESDWDYRISTEAGERDATCDDSTLTVSGLDYKEGEVPYMDTMENGCTCGPGLTISAYGCQDYELLNQNGQLRRGYTCANCGDWVSEDDYQPIDGNVYCEDCANKLFSYCDNCEEMVPVDDCVSIEDTSIYVCSSCAADKFTVCEDCGAYNKDDYIVIEDYAYCLSCAEEYPICEECGEQSTDGNFVNEDGLCKDCEPESEELPVFVPKEFPGQWGMGK